MYAAKLPLLQVYDMPTSVRFNRDALGFEVVARTARVTLKAPAVASHGMEQINFRDPDGCGLCFQWPTDPPTGGR
jgi:catechol 2,3-dioxygenase-like lactoylglutathione lyase family enzyme